MRVRNLKKMLGKKAELEEPWQPDDDCYCDYDYLPPVNRQQRLLPPLFPEFRLRLDVRCCHLACEKKPVRHGSHLFVFRSKTFLPNIFPISYASLKL
jgi:hypothetical protein